MLHSASGIFYFWENSSRMTLSTLVRHNYTVPLLCFLFLITILPLGFAQQPFDSLLRDHRWRNIGPANQGGRIVDIEAIEGDFRRVYVATGSGGVWYSDNAGTTWRPIFDRYETASIGDIALFPSNPSILWVGTGEANNRNSTSWGNGVYKSSDGGKSFRSVGLENTHHIARVRPHPTDSNDVCVCATGHLWGYSGDRGLFRTQDGGITWTKLGGGLPDDGKTGCTDLIRDPNNPDVLYVAFYHRRRQPWTFTSGGEAGGIFKSENGGKTWQRLTNGLPTPTGRIGLAVSRSNPQILMALVEAPKSDTLSVPGSGLYRSEDGGTSWTYVNTYNNRPFYYSQVRIHPTDPQRVYLLTTRFMVSEDGGKTLRNGSADQEVHGDFHAMWLDPDHSDRYYLGADKGLSITHDHGEHFRLIDNLPIGQFYRIGLDMQQPYMVYGGLQDNGAYAMRSFGRDARGLLSDHHWKMHWGDGMYAAIDPDDWRTVYTSAENDGFYRYDPLTHEIHNIHPHTGNVLNLHDYFPDGLPDSGQVFRFNWEAPMQLAPHPSKNLYIGGNYLFRSTDGGNHWSIISPDLTTNDPVKRQIGKSGGLTLDNSGAEHHCSISTVAVSPLDEAVIWVGTDDGLAHRTSDGGRTWQALRQNIPGVPEGIWVSRIEASHHDASVAYLTFDGHRSDDFSPYLFRTEDGGDTWKSLTNDLPAGTVIRVIREDPVNPNLLFVGTETRILASLDGGATWQSLNLNLPTVSVYDIAIHPKAGDLVAGTHGRSIWILDDIQTLQKITEDIRNSEVHLFEPAEQVIWHNTSRGGQRGHFLFAGGNPPEIRNTSSRPRARFATDARIPYYVGKVESTSSPLVLTIRDYRGHRHIDTLEQSPGIHFYHWNRAFEISEWTNTEKNKVDRILESLRPLLTSEGYQRLLERYQEADTAYDQRKFIDDLREDYPALKIDPQLGVPFAGPGAYSITLQWGQKVMHSTLTLVPDPLGKR